MIVVKIGGSLCTSPPYLKNWLDQLALIKSEDVVIVPGGGPFADQVRTASAEWKISDEISHQMAVLAMQEFSLLMMGINKTLVPLHSYKDVSINSGVKVWMPYSDVCDECNYPQNWQTTSDSLAVWLAVKLSADELYIVKSAEINNKSTDELVNSDWVDDYFAKAIMQFNGKVKFFHSSQSSQIKGSLINE